MAEKLSPQQISNPILRATDNQSTNQVTYTEEAQTPSVRSGETESIKQLALKMYGCDCPSCQAMASNLLLQGRLPSL